MNKKIFFSVGIPNYNHSMYLPAALDSVLNQSCQPDEIVVIDDCSTDNSVEIIENYIKKYPSKIRLVKNSKNMGVIGVLNTAILEMKGKYVFILAADDRLLPGLFEKSFKLLDRFPDAGFSCSDTKTVWMHSGKEIVNRRGLKGAPSYIAPHELASIMRKKIVSLSAFGAVFRRDTLLETNGIAELKWSIDRFFATVIAFRYGICYIPEVLTLQQRRIDSYSETGVSNKDAHLEIIKNALILLDSPRFSDVKDKFVFASAFSSFGFYFVETVFRNFKYRSYLTFNLIFLLVINLIKEKIRKLIPENIKRCLRQ